MYKVLCCICACLLKVPHKCVNQDKNLNVKIHSYVNVVVVAGGGDVIIALASQ